MRAAGRLAWALSSEGERYVDIVEVAGSIPAAPTILSLPTQRRVCRGGASNSGHPDRGVAYPDCVTEASL